MKKLILGLLLIASACSFAQTAKSVSDLTTQVNVIRNETAVGGNTRGRMADMYQSTFLSSPNIFGSYSNPSWITGLNWSKILSTPTTIAGYGIMDAPSGSGTTNEIAYFPSSSVLSSLTTATYPSLTEISYVKGLTGLAIGGTTGASDNSLIQSVGTGGRTVQGSLFFVDNGDLVIGSAAAAVNASISTINSTSNSDLSISSERSLNLQTTTAGKLGFFNGTPVVKQSAVTTSQGIADALTAYGLLPSSTVSGGGISALTNGNGTTVGADLTSVDLGGDVISPVRIDVTGVSPNSFVITEPTNNNVFGISTDDGTEYAFGLFHSNAAGTESAALTFDVNNILSEGAGIIFTDGRSSKKGIEYAATGYVTQTHSIADKEYVDAKVSNTITNGVTTIAPAQDAVFDALALKAPLASPTFTGTVTIPSGGVFNTPTSLTGTNITGTASGLTSGNVTTNANLTGPITSVGNATSIASSISLPGSPTTTTQSANDNSIKISTTAYTDRQAGKFTEVGTIINEPWNNLTSWTQVGTATWSVSSNILTMVGGSPGAPTFSNYIRNSGYGNSGYQLFTQSTDITIGTIDATSWGVALGVQGIGTLSPVSVQLAFMLNSANSGELRIYNSHLSTSQYQSTNVRLTVSTGDVVRLSTAFKYASLYVEAFNVTTGEKQQYTVNEQDLATYLSFGSTLLTCIPNIYQHSIYIMGGTHTITSSYTVTSNHRVRPDWLIVGDSWTASSESYGSKSLTNLLSQKTLDYVSTYAGPADRIQDYIPAEILAINPVKILTLTGLNNAAAGESAATISGRFTTLFSSLTGYTIGSNLFMCEIPPYNPGTGVSTINASIRSTFGTANVVPIYKSLVNGSGNIISTYDTFDGNHLNPFGLEVLSNVIFNNLAFTKNLYPRFNNEGSRFTYLTGLNVGTFNQGNFTPNYTGRTAVVNIGNIGSTSAQINLANNNTAGNLAQVSWQVSNGTFAQTAMAMRFDASGVYGGSASNQNGREWDVTDGITAKRRIGVGGASGNFYVGPTSSAYSLFVKGVDDATTASTVIVGGSFAAAYVAKTALYTLTPSDYAVEVTGGTHTQTLPTAVGISGRLYTITNSGSGVVTIATTSSQTFSNVTGTPTTLTLAQFQSVTVQSNGATWLVTSTNLALGMFGTYTPTLSNTTNVTSSTPIICHYIRVGNQVTVTGSAGVVTTLAVATVLGISLPSGATSNFAATTDASGLGQASSAVATNAYVEANTTTDVAELKFTGLSVGGSGTIFFSFTYTVI